LQLLARTAATTNKYFAELETIGHDVNVDVDPITDWLSTPPILTITDPIKFWTRMEGCGHPLVWMALDFLSAPASSTDVERAFSHGGLTVSKQRHCLSDDMVRMATVLGSWCDLAGLIPHAELIKTFNDKSKRPKGKEVSVEADNGMLNGAEDASVVVLA
jgi:hypothetical protein